MVSLFIYKFAAINLNDINMNEKKYLSYLKQFNQWLMINKEIEPLDDIKEEIKYWDYIEVLEVHEALQKTNESINKLGLVPVSL